MLLRLLSIADCSVQPVSRNNLSPMSLNAFRFNSIFIRVYLHMLLAMLLVVVLAVCATSLINHVREEQYREELVSGTFYLLSRGWQKQDAADRHDWLAGAGKLLNSELQTVLAEHVALNSWQQRRLQEKKNSDNPGRP